MRDPRNALAAELRRSADAAREAKAATLYAPEALRAAMVREAGAGFDHATIPGPVGLDLRATVAGIAAAEWLKGEGIAGRWDSRTGAAGAEAAPSFDLVMTWRTAAVVG